MDQFDTSEQSADALNLTEVLRDCLPGGVLAVDHERQIYACNAKAAVLTGFKQDALIGQTSGVLPPPIMQLIDECLASQSAISLRKVSWVGQDGRTSVLQAGGLYCAAGVIVTIHDLAPVQRLGVDMRRLDRLASIGTLSASMAHEIKNALVAVSTFVNDLLQRNRDSELAGLVSRELRRIDGIVSQMLKFAGPTKATFSRVSLHRILDQSLRLIQPQLETKQIRLRRAMTARPDVVEGDDYQLEQAFLNVLLNGIAAMGPHGQLSVATERTGPAPGSASPEGEAAEPRLQVTITDTGAGIPADQLGRLFEPFFSTKPQGTGLGLAITRRIILEHRGAISVESEVGKGTTFRIVLPLAAPKG
jgi:two-component system, NtrC family, sensor histidine kinase HydH